jgi:hypothetical protein
MPVWAAVAAVAAAYALRSIIRGGDFRPDLPIDAILLAILAVLIAARWAVGRSPSDEDPGAPGSAGAPTALDDTDGTPGA